VRLASLTSPLKRLCRRLQRRGTATTTSSTSTHQHKRFMRWHVGQDTKTGEWRVIDEVNVVICRGLADKDDAERIARNHNELDPIKSWEDWLFYRDKY
jgi:hypothetical protein